MSKYRKLCVDGYTLKSSRAVIVYRTAFVLVTAIDCILSLSAEVETIGLWVRIRLALYFSSPDLSASFPSISCHELIGYTLVPGVLLTDSSNPLNTEK